MQIELLTTGLDERRVKPEDTETYVIFRNAIPKPSSEETHIRHILRFYIARAMQKRGLEKIYILPELRIDDQEVQVDVAAETPEGYALSICEPESVTPQTKELLKLLTQVDDAEVVVVHSQYGDAGNVMDEFHDAIASKKLRLLAVVPPPFDDVYEYDIWMFETTFRDLFEAQ